MNIQDMLQGTSALIFALAMYILMALPLYTIAQRTNTNNAWFAFVPILNLLLMLDIADRDLWWIILFCIPCVNVVIYVMCWMDIADAMNKPSWLGLLMLIPGVSAIVPFYIAFG